MTLASHGARRTSGPLLDELERLYPGSDDVPVAHLEALARQSPTRPGAYEVREERMEWALALVRPDGFDRGTGAGGEELLHDGDHLPEGSRDAPAPGGRGARAESGRVRLPLRPVQFRLVAGAPSVFALLLRELNLRRGEVEDIYFTGGLTDPAKTDFHVEYRRARTGAGTLHAGLRHPQAASRGSPRHGRVLIVEVKADDPVRRRPSGTTRPGRRAGRCR